MGKTVGTPSIVLDAGALIALERGDGRMRALCREALHSRVKLVIPAGVVAQVARGGGHPHALHALLGAAATEVPPLDCVFAVAVGALCASSGTRDVVDASVVLAARRFGAIVVTSDEGDLRRIDPAIRVEAI